MKLLAYIFLFLFANNLFCQNCPCVSAFYDLEGYVQRVKKLSKNVYFGNSVDSLPRFSNSECNNPMYGNNCFYEYISKHLPNFDESQIADLEVRQTVVKIGFVVKKDGSLENVKIVHASLSPTWDVAHLSAVKKCPKFVSPAKIKNSIVDYYCEVNFEHKRIY